MFETLKEAMQAAFADAESDDAREEMLNGWSYLMRELLRQGAITQAEYDWYDDWSDEAASEITGLDL